MTAYRYRLDREVNDQGHGCIAWVMLNPSTADERLDDQTIRRIRYYSAVAGFARLEVVNLFAVRSTLPSELPHFADPIGPLNDEAIFACLSNADAVAVAWGGTCPSRLLSVARQRRQKVFNLCRDLGHDVLCLGVTAGGHPRHPSRLGNDVTLKPFARAAGVASVEPAQPEMEN